MECQSPIAESGQSKNLSFIDRNNSAHKDGSRGKRNSRYQERRRQEQDVDREKEVQGEVLRKLMLEKKKRDTNRLRYGQ